MRTLLRPACLRASIVMLLTTLAACSRAEPDADSTLARGPVGDGTGRYTSPPAYKADGHVQGIGGPRAATGPFVGAHQPGTAGRDTVHFAADSAALSPDAQRTLTEQAVWLASHTEFAIVVEGHADERGTREYNIALGARRATAVRDFLAARGIAAQRLRTVSFGKERPVASCNDISCWSQNRRARSVLAPLTLSRR